MHWFKGEVHRYSCVRGINVMTIQDRSVGIARIEDDFRYWFKNTLGAIKKWIQDHFPRAADWTGVYKKIDGKWVRVSTRTSGIDVWMSKYKFLPDQGLREQHNMFVDMAQRGKLNDVDDRAVWEESKARYGRDKVWTGSRKETIRKNGRQK